MNGPLPWWDVALRLGVAIAAGALLGFEREVRDKPAGLRTHVLVALGSAAFVVASVQFALDWVREHPGSQIDVLRVVQGIVGGIGFIGAGAVIRAGGDVHGLTTAASIWVASAIGVACGLAYYSVAGMVALAGVAVLSLLGLLEYRVIEPKRKDRSEEEK